MTSYEYRVVPAPTKGLKSKGKKTPEDRFAYSVEDLLNRMGAEGWEYQRAELLPSEERAGLTGSATNWRNVLVFRRPLSAEAAAAAPRTEPASRRATVAVLGGAERDAPTMALAAVTAPPVRRPEPTQRPAPEIVATRETPEPKSASPQIAEFPGHARRRPPPVSEKSTSDEDD